jgi:hypothetical protein
LAFAGVHAFARVVGGLTAPLALTFVHALAGVFTFLSVIHCLDWHAGIGPCPYGVSAHREGTGHQAGYSRARDHCFGWFHFILPFYFQIGAALMFACSRRLHQR